VEFLRSPGEETIRIRKVKNTGAMAGHDLSDESHDDPDLEDAGDETADASEE
jgi:hypothetical protein